MILKINVKLLKFNFVNHFNKQETQKTLQINDKSELYEDFMIAEF